MVLGAEVIMSAGEVEEVNFAFYVPLLSNVRLVTCELAASAMSSEMQNFYLSNE